VYNNKKLLLDNCYWKIKNVFLVAYEINFAGVWSLFETDFTHSSKILDTSLTEGLIVPSLFKNRGNSLKMLYRILKPQKK